MVATCDSLVFRHKKTGGAGFSYHGRYLCHGFDAAAQTALVTSGFVLVNLVFVSNAINNGNGGSERGLCSGFVSAFNGSDHFLDESANSRAQAVVVVAVFVGLNSPFFGLFCVCHVWKPRDLCGGCTPAGCLKIRAADYDDKCRFCQVTGPLFAGIRPTPSLHSTALFPDGVGQVPMCCSPSRRVRHD